MIILPSLEIVPAKYNTSTNTLLSQIPIDGTGDFTVTRATSPTTGRSTRVNALGLIELVADNVPRLDYPLGGAVNGCPALLVEPSAQNLVLQSAGFSVSATWVPEGTPNPTQVTANTTATLDPAGGNTADIITLVSGNANQLRQSFVSTSGTTYTVSVFLKNIALTSGQTFLFSTTNQEATVNQVNCTIDLANLTIAAVTVGTGVTVSNAALDNYGNGWYRARFTFSFAVGGINSYIRLRQPNSVGTNYAFYAWGAQLELGSIATSYIPTTTAAVTRGAEAISKTGVSSLIGQTEGTLYFEIDVQKTAAATRNIIEVTDGTSSNRFFARLYDDSGTQRIEVALISSNGFAARYQNLAMPAGIYKVAFAYAQNNFACFVNGVQNGTTDTSGNCSASYSTINLGSAAGNVSFFNDRIRAAALYPTRLTDTQLALLTSPYTSYSSMASALSYTLG